MLVDFWICTKLSWNSKSVCHFVVKKDLKCVHLLSELQEIPDSRKSVYSANIWNSRKCPYELRQKFLSIWRKKYTEQVGSRSKRPPFRSVLKEGTEGVRPHLSPAGGGARLPLPQAAQPAQRGKPDCLAFSSPPPNLHDVLMTSNQGRPEPRLF